MIDTHDVDIQFGKMYGMGVMRVPFYYSQQCFSKGGICYVTSNDNYKDLHVAPIFSFVKWMKGKKKSDIPNAVVKSKIMKKHLGNVSQFRPPEATLRRPLNDSQDNLNIRQRGGLLYSTAVGYKKPLDFDRRR